MKSPSRSLPRAGSVGGRRRLASTTAIVTVSTLAFFGAASAAAQDAEQGPADQVSVESTEAPQTEGSIIITGSRVARLGFDSPSPLTVLSQDQIENEAPTNNLFDLVSRLPAVAGSLQLSNSRLAISSGLSGINGINLRNLGLERTLVLLDGRRSVGSSVTGIVDINTFPQQLVSRVEVVTGGASAAYGSDAVAGVINFVLDKEFTGLRVNGNLGITDEGDGFNYQINVAGGTDFADGRGHILLSGEYARSDGLFEVDRDWNFGVNQIIANPAFTATNGQPQFLQVGPGNRNNSTPGGIINASAGGTANRLRGIYFGPGGAINRYDYGTISTTAISIGGDYLVDDSNRRIGLAPDEDRRNVYGRLSYEILPWATAFFEASYSWQETRFNAGPQFATGRVLRGDNAFVINTLGALATGITTITVGTTQADLPFRTLNNQRDVQRYAGGFEGEFNLFEKPAIWNAYLQYGETNTREQLRDIIINTNYNNAIDAVFAPAGNAAGVPAGTIVCRSRLTNPTNGCVPLNILGIGVSDPAAIDYVLGDPFRNQTLKQTVGGVNLSFTPFATWAGDVGIAIGGEYRKEEVSGSVPQEFQTGFQVGNYLPTFGEYEVSEAYLEAIVPLGLGLVVNGAVRATDYSTSGYVTTWKVGGTFEPIEDIRLRATLSHDIRAPNLNELFQSGTSRTNTLTNAFVTPAQVITFRETTTGNLDLDPEVADSFSAGVVLSPRFLPGLQISVDYFDIEIEGAIGQFFAQDIFNRCNEGFLQFCAGFGPDPTGDRELVFRASPFNFASIRTEGIDFDLSYRIPMDDLLGPDSTLVLRALASHYLENVVDDGISTPVDTVGSLGGSGPPDWLYRFSAGLDTPGFGITAVGRGVSSGTYLNTFFECPAGSCPATSPLARTINDNSIDGVFYLDLNAVAKIDLAQGSETEVFFQVTNVFDADPIILPETGLAANSTYSDLLGRTFRLGVRFEF